MSVYLPSPRTAEPVPSPAPSANDLVWLSAVERGELVIKVEASGWNVVETLGVLDPATRCSETATQAVGNYVRVFLARGLVEPGPLTVIPWHHGSRVLGKRLVLTAAGAAVLPSMTQGATR